MAFRPPRITAGRTASIAFLAVAAVLGVSCGSEEGGGGEPTPAALQTITAPAASPTVGTNTTVRVRVIDADGTPVAGTTVQWTILAGDGFAPATSTTGVDGETQVTWAIGTAVGINSLEAEVDGVAPLQFDRTSVPGAVQTLLPQSATLQAGSPSTAVAIPPSVKAVDAYLNPIPNLSLTVTSTGGSTPSSGTILTAGTGIASLTSWTLGPAAGVTDTLRIQAGVGPIAVFRATKAAAVDSTPTLLVIQSAPTFTVAGAGNIVGVRLIDADSAPISGATVTWTVTAGGGGAPATSQTDSVGEARVTWTTGGSAGVNTLRASAPGTDTVTFTTTGYIPGGPVATLEATTTIPDSVAVNTPLLLGVRALDSLGAPVPGVNITWSVVHGNTSPPDFTTTDAQGETSETLYVSSVPSADTFQASVGGAPPVVRWNVTAIPRIQFGELMALTDTAQGGTPSQPVAVLPRVRVADQYGNPKVGIPLTVAVLFGGGTAAPDTIVSDSAGEAVVGSWTLGPATGTVNTLRISAPSGAFQDFDATTPTGGGSFTFEFSTPTPLQLVGDSFDVAVRVTSTFQVDSVRASVGDSSRLLQYNAGQNRWLGWVRTTGIPSDTILLEVRATDAFGAGATAQQQVILDRPPGVTLTAPSNHSVARPTVHVSATCTDDGPGGCVDTYVAIAFGPKVADGVTSVDSVTSLASHEGQEVGIRATGVDSRGQTTTTPQQQVYVESSSKLVGQVTIDGFVLDRDVGRILYRPNGSTAVVVTNLAGTVADTIPVADDETVVQGRLTSAGAAFVSHFPGFVNYRLTIRRNGVTSVHPSSNSWQITGDYAVVSSTASPATVTRHDLAGGGSTVITATGAVGGHSVSAQGDVSYLNNVDALYLYKNGGSTLIEPSSATIDPRNASTDSGRVLYLRRTNLNDNRVILFDNGTSTELADLGTYVGEAGRDMAMANGWIAFVKLNVGVRQVWTRTSAGVLRQVSFFGAHSRIEALGHDGSIVIASGNRRYWVGTGSATPVDIGSSTFGRVVWVNGSFRSLIGNSTFDVAP
jgi:hypothetical protein